MKNAEFIENLDRLYTKIHRHKMDESFAVPNIRLMLGFAARIIESVKAAYSNSDFISEQRHFKQRYQDFYTYFVKGTSELELVYPECDFITE